MAGLVVVLFAAAGVYCVQCTELLSPNSPSGNPSDADEVKADWAALDEAVEQADREFMSQLRQEFEEEEAGGVGAAVRVTNRILTESGAARRRLIYGLRLWSPTSVRDVIESLKFDQLEPDELRLLADSASAIEVRLPRSAAVDLAGRGDWHVRARGYRALAELFSDGDDDALRLIIAIRRTDGEERAIEWYRASLLNASIARFSGDRCDERHFIDLSGNEILACVSILRAWRCKCFYGKRAVSTALDASGRLPRVAQLSTDVLGVWAVRPLRASD